MASKDLKLAIESLNWESARSLAIACKPGSLYELELGLTAAIHAAPDDVFDLLVSKGVDVNEINKFGDTALTLAVWHCHPPHITAKLIQLGADVKLANTSKFVSCFVNFEWLMF
jgi:ankyrin repeat protein